MRIAVSVAEKEIAKGPDSPYFRALVEAGAKPEELELVNAREAQSIEAGIRSGVYDGVLFTGGEDVDPTLYQESVKYDNVRVNRERDDFEMALLDQAMNRRLPILGICRGVQMINVKFGGTLYQDLAGDRGPEFVHRQQGSRSETTHEVTLTDPDSRLGEAVSGSCRVNSLHHQAIKRLGRGLKVTAHSEDGLVEAVEAAGSYPFLLAVQWHPEEIVDRPEQREILTRFLKACREKAEEQGKQPE